MQGTLTTLGVVLVLVALVLRLGFVAFLGCMGDDHPLGWYSWGHRPRRKLLHKVPSAARMPPETVWRPGVSVYRWR
ncbi:hypothetical protein GCM10023205_74030 [Yinghuangia aomiensis]|uniref:Secreted protein n=1 Tax=Yinghuangia aomiensis TaxID=676205 RepID=A0ABP9IAC9_9ACTN